MTTKIDAVAREDLEPIFLLQGESLRGKQLSEGWTELLEDVPIDVVDGGRMEFRTTGYELPSTKIF